MLGWMSGPVRISFEAGLLCKAALLLGLLLPQGLAQSTPAPGPACLQPGVTGTFYDLTKNEAQYLDGQFPFQNGPGQLLSTISPTQTVVVPEVNFAPDNIQHIDKLSDPLSPWPRQFPTNSNGTIALFDASVQVPQSGFWTFFVSSSSPMELTLSQNGTSFEALKSGDEVEVINATVDGYTHAIQYNLAVGMYDLHLEWHHGLPGDPITNRLLVLEWAYTANPATVPSPSPPQIPRAVVPARYLSTPCLAKNATGPAAAEPVFSPPPPTSRPSPPPGELSNLSLPPAPPAVAASPPPPPSGMPAASTPGFACQAMSQVSAPFPEGSGYSFVVSLHLTAADGTVKVPYSISIGNPAYESAAGPFNWQINGSSDNGTFQGTVMESWEKLTNNPINLGAIFHTSADASLPPTSVTVEGVACALSQA